MKSKIKPKPSASNKFKPQKQLSLTDSLAPGQKKTAGFTPRIVHGGEESKGKRKTARPFSPKAPLHISLKSNRARGLWSLKHRKNESKIAAMVYVYAARFRVHVYSFANVGNHLHLLVKANDRKDLADYLRVLAGRVAITVSGAQKHIKRIGKFWNHLCWSKLISWGKHFHHASRYVLANYLEGFNKNFRGLVLENDYLIPD